MQLRSGVTYNTTQKPCLASHKDIVEHNNYEENGVEIVEHSLSGAAIGRSVVALKNFAKHEIVCWFGGDVIDDAMYKIISQTHRTPCPRGAYFMEIDENWCVDGWPLLASAQGFKANFVNDSHNIDGAQPNVFAKFEAMPSAKNKIYQVSYRALRSINKGEEIWIDYGGAYWRAEHVGNAECVHCLQTSEPAS